MRVAVASDHVGFRLKEKIVELLEGLDHEVMDLGCFSQEPVDYPDYALAIGKAIREGVAQRGVFLCGSGVGASIAANKVHGIRAALCHDIFSAHQSIEDDDANVLCLGANVVGESLAEDLLQAWMSARFSGLDRHRRRVEKIMRIERDMEFQQPKHRISGM
jgi:RpiB/LacA/LacB family sugar-phosphate isomerase